MATGTDAVYLTTDRDVVEPARLLPLLTTRDTVTGVAGGRDLPRQPLGETASSCHLDDYPRLADYLETERRGQGRHVAQKNPDRWYRTIDRVDPTLLERAKLVIPDLKAHIHPVLDRGETYPHHSLYFVTSDAWDLEVLGGLLLSDIAELFVATYCVKMRGGCYRFQAQYLRRIRVPDRVAAVGSTRHELARAFAGSATVSALLSLARAAYGLAHGTLVASR